MTPLYLRRADAPDTVIGPLSAAQILEAVPAADDCVTDQPSMPFIALDRDLDRNGRLREAMLDACPMPAASRYARWRPLLLGAMVPLFLMVALDRDLLQAARPGAAAALAADVLIALVVASDLGRRTPRYPQATAAALVATALRFAFLVASRCGRGVHPLIVGLGVLSAASALSVGWLSPSPRQIADHLRRSLSIAPPTRIPSRTSRGYGSYIAYALAAGAALPTMLWALREGHVPAHVQLLAFLLFGWIVPSAGRVMLGREHPLFRRALAGALGLQMRTLQLGGRAVLRASLRVLGAAVAALVLCFAMVRSVQHGLDTAAATQRCVSPDAADTTLQRFMDQERAEAASGHRSPRADPMFFVLTVGLIPVAEELVYRGLVQHALRRRLRRRLAIGLSALIFGLAHLLVYKTVVYQTVLLGLGFGLAYEWAGILAGTLAHMLWNLWLSL